MDTKTIAVIVISVVIIAALVLFAGAGAHASQPNALASSQGPSGNSSKVLLSSTQYAQYAYQAYPGPLSHQARAALSGFNLTYTTLQNSSIAITVRLDGTSQYQNMILAPGYKLYVVEATLGDDGLNFDSSLGDDGFVIVDPNGYLSQ